MLAVAAVIIFVGLGFFIAAHGKAHERETGLPSPSRETAARISRDAIQRGISEQQAYGEWVAAEQRRVSAAYHQRGSDPAPRLGAE